MKKCVVAACALLAALGCAEEITESVKFTKDTVILVEIRNLQVAEMRFKTEHWRYGTLSELKEEGLVTARFASGRIDDYIITEVSVEANSYAFRFDPAADDKLGLRHFYVDQSGLVRARKDGPAGPADPPLSG